MAPVFPPFKSVRTVLVKVFHMNKTHYGHFLRMYNRRQYHTAEEFRDKGYAGVEIEFKKITIARRWCQKNLKEGTYAYANGHFFFAYDKDATLFSLSI